MSYCPLVAFTFFDIYVKSLMQLLWVGAGDDFFSDCCVNLKKKPEIEFDLCRVLVVGFAQTEN